MSIAKESPIVRVIIPAFNEESSIGKVISDIPKTIVSEVIVVNNASTDDTKQVAISQGATVIDQYNQGYGYACLTGISYLKNSATRTDIVVFIDGDYSDFPEEIVDLIQPIVVEDYDFVIGSRVLGKREKYSLTPQQLFGNWLATKLLKILYRSQFTDLGPFRAIKFDKLLSLNMQDTTYGWTVEMQAKASKLKLRSLEIPVKYRKRIGKSKISGTVKGSVLAGYKIITTIFKYR